MNRLFQVTLIELDEDGEHTGRRMMTFLSSTQLEDEDLERLFELVNGAELKPDAV